MNRSLRLLSPRRRRIVTLDRFNPAHAGTLAQLSRLGWRVYVGPAQTDSNGWVLAGTDPKVQPDPYEIRTVPR